MKPFHKMTVREVIESPEFKSAYEADMKPILAPGNGRNIAPVPADEIAGLMLRELGNAVRGKVLSRREDVSISRGLTIVGHMIMQARKNEKASEEAGNNSKNN